MTMREFIKQNRATIDESISRVCNHVPRQASCDCPLSGTDHDHADNQRINDADRRSWIANNEALYNWARSEGVKI